jgi:capsid assembly protease
MSDLIEPMQISPNLTIPYLDQWLGTWFIEPERGQALHSAMRQLNIGVHLQSQASAQSNYTPRQFHRSQRDELAQNPDPTPSAIDWEQAPRSRSAYGYRNFDGVAVLELNGSLMKHEASATESTSTTMMRRTVRKLMNDGAVKAVIFQIDSPGGTVAGLFDLAADIAALAKVKKVHGHASNLIASAAYALGSQMHSLSATPSTLVGSLGTFGVVYDFSVMCAKDGVKVHLLKGKINGKTALMKGAGTPGTEISPEQLARMQEGVDDLNQQFYSGVISGPRKPKPAAVESWFVDAGVWIANKAMTMGLIDRVESFDEMLARVSGEAKNAKRDTVPSTNTRPTEGTDSTGRKASVQLTKTDGDRSMTYAGESVEQVMQLMNAIQSPQTQTNNQAEAAALGDVPPVAGAEAEQPAVHTVEKVGADMSQTTATAPAPVATEPKTETKPDVKPAAASMVELKAAFPGASSDWLVEQSVSGATMDQATKSFIGWQSAQIAARDADIAKRDAQIAKLAEAKPAAQTEAPAPVAKKPGVPALASAAAEQGNVAAPVQGDHKAQAKAEWDANRENCQSEFFSEKVYVAARVPELQGRVRSAKK